MILGTIFACALGVANCNGIHFQAVYPDFATCETDSHERIETERQSNPNMRFGLTCLNLNSICGGEQGRFPDHVWKWCPDE